MSKIVEQHQDLPLLRESAHQIWLAGLGALSLVEDEGGKFFKSLVKRGKVFESETKDRVEELKAKLDVKKAATDAMDRIGDGVDENLTAVLHRLGLPTKKEIDGLSKRVDRLTKTLEVKPARHAPRRRVSAKRAIPATTV
jgi:poly(hydroxyalkanoate) granule-associated protein